MPRKIEVPNICYWHERYMAGESTSALADELGMNPNLLLRRFAEHDLPRKPAHGHTGNYRVLLPHHDELLRRYLAGESENKLAREAGVNRWTFRRRILAAGIIPRGKSEAETLKWAQMMPTERASQVAAAHDATRGVSQTWEKMCARALGVEKSLPNAAPVEFTLADALRSYGLAITQQKALGIYNLDVALDELSIAVEVFGGNWHSQGNHLARFFKRSIYVLNSGWHLVILWVDGRRHPFGLGAVEYLVAFAEKARRNPTMCRQYRVILGNGQVAPIRKTYLNRPADIERLGCTLHTAGCYDFVAG